MVFLQVTSNSGPPSPCIPLRRLGGGWGGRLPLRWGGVGLESATEGGVGGWGEFMEVWETPWVRPKPHPLHRRIYSSPPTVEFPPEAGGTAKMLPGVLPLLCNVPWGRSLSGLVTWVGARWFGMRQNISRGSPPDGVCLGGPIKILPGVPPSPASRAWGEEPVRAGGPGGRLLIQYGTRIFVRVYLPDGKCPGGPWNFFPGVPPSSARRAWVNNFVGQIQNYDYLIVCVPLSEVTRVERYCGGIYSVPLN